MEKPSFSSTSANVAASRRNATFTPAEPRMPVVTAAYQQPATNLGTATSSSPVRYPDEYLLDGGDRGLPIHYNNFNRKGLETEDTVAEYVDHRGQRHVRGSNRVAIYAPRFGALRSVSEPVEGFVVQRLASNFETSRGAGLRNRTAPTHHAQREGAGGVRMRSRASGLGAGAAQHSVEQATTVTSHTKLINVYQDLTFLRTGRMVQTDEARLAYGIQAAAVWTRDENPVVTATIESSQDVYAQFQPQQYVGLEHEHKTKGQLRIIKLADKKTATPGQIVTFTIRYDNLGDRELYHIRIVDNLTPRLEYVDDSATSDRAGRLVVEDNEEGSLVLRFEVDDPLPGHQGGVVTFQARVR